MRAASAGLAWLIGCAHGSPVAPPSSASEPIAAQTSPDREIELVALVDLPRTESSEGLSGTSFEPETRTLLAVQDKAPRLVPLIASADYRSWTVGQPMEFGGRPDAEWDGEGVARAGDELLVIAHESRARIERFTLAGDFRALLPVPAYFAHARANKGLEALAASPSGRFVFFANEAALEDDGPLATREAGTVVRVVRRDLGSARYEEREYRTEPLERAGGEEGEMGVADLAALSDHELLVLERGYQPGYGNSARIFRCDFAATPPRLGAERPLLHKTLVVDVADLPAGASSHPSPQPNPLLENYEALSIGPTLADGRALLLLTSDDNARAAQRARILVLAARLR